MLDSVAEAFLRTKPVGLLVWPPHPAPPRLSAAASTPTPPAPSREGGGGSALSVTVSRWPVPSSARFGPCRCAEPASPPTRTPAAPRGSSQTESPSLTRPDSRNFDPLKGTGASSPPCITLWNVLERPACRAGGPNRVFLRTIFSRGSSFGSKSSPEKRLI